MTPRERAADVVARCVAQTGLELRLEVAIEAAVAEERSACLALAERTARLLEREGSAAGQGTAEAIANLIRARGTPAPSPSGPAEVECTPSPCEFTGHRVRVPKAPLLQRPTTKVPVHGQRRV